MKFLLQMMVSKTETKKLIDKYKKLIPNLNHIWHEDNGYRRAGILNKCILSTDCDYIITTDQDCILHKNYIQDHKHFAEKGHFVSAYRTFVLKPITKFVLKFKVIPHRIFFILNCKIHLKYNIRLESKWEKYTKIITDDSNHTFGCNMAFWKEDLLKVNGFNEDFTGWGPEDSEMSQRLLNIGIKRKKIGYSAIVYHLYHKELSKMNYDINESKWQKAIKEKLIWTENGIIKNSLD
jgi:predicted glycosyltransferase involved in capsule biosynthesis